MIKLNSPHLLFTDSKVFANIQNVEKTPQNAHNKDEIKAVVLYTHTNEEMPKSQREMLDKMMAACKFQPNEVKFINNKAETTGLSRIYNSWKPEIVLLFGRQHLGKNMTDLKKNIPVTLNGVKVIQAELLDKLETDGAEKKKLWTSLQYALGL